MSSFELVNAPDSAPYSCFCGTAGQAPFVSTHIAQPGGGVYFICATCARRIMLAYGVVMKADFDTMQTQLADAREQAATATELRAELADREAKLENLRGEVAALQAERSMSIAAITRLQNDVDDRANGVLERSRVGERRDEIAAEVVAASAKAKRQPRAAA